jgi:hypothetical protein
VVTNGVLAWTPTEAQGPSTNTVSVSVSDGIATVTNSFTVVVREVNALPTLPGATNATLTATVAYVRNLGASDSDVPAQSLTLSLLQGPTGLLVTNGVLAWTPTQLQASTTNTVRVSVSDGVGAVTNSFTLIVTALSGGGASVSSVGGAQLASAMAPGEDAARRILVRRLEASEDSMEVLWMEGHGTLEEAPTPEGPWVPVGATGGLHRVRLEGEARYFRVRW